MGSPVATGRGSRTAHTLLLALVLLVALTAGGQASAATFLVLNLCPFPVWPAAVPMGTVGTGPLSKLDHEKAWFVRMPPGPAKIWGRTGCDFTGDREHGACSTGDCAGALHCQSMGKAPATAAVFTTTAGGGDDTFAVSVADGFNLPLDISCGRSGIGNPDPDAAKDQWVRCREAGCPDAMKVRSCIPDGDYAVVFCPYKD